MVLGKTYKRKPKAPETRPDQAVSNYYRWLLTAGDGAPNAPTINNYQHWKETNATT